ncbi:MAG: DUF5678 domain-containing protein [Candidatus Nanohalobium sp.]
MTLEEDVSNFDRENSEFLEEGDIPEEAKGNWIAISRGEIIAIESSEMQAYQKAESRSDSENFLLTKVPDDSKARLI